MVGFTQPDEIEGQYLTVEDKAMQIIDSEYLYHSELVLVLSEKFYEHERQVYSFFQLIADLGGYNSAIMMLPSLLMSHYNQIMYHHSIAQETAVSSQKKPKRNSKRAVASSASEQ